MEISASSVNMAASWQRLEAEVSRMTLRTREPGEERDESPNGPDRPENSRPARHHTAQGLRADDTLLLLKALIENLTGRTIRVPEALEGAESEPLSRQTDTGTQFEIEVQSMRFLHEEVEYKASGRVQTADGREIRFDLTFSLERTEVSMEKATLRVGKDPLVLDFAATGARLSGREVQFDLDMDGNPDALPVPAGDRGYLVQDLNGNGKVDDGSELFGPTSGDGFLELAALDDDGNRWIDEGDRAFDRLGLWRPGEAVVSLRNAGVGAIYTGSVETPWRLTQGVMRSSGVYLNEDGSAGTISRIDLIV